MSKEIYISSTPHETRLAIVENDALSEIYYERENEYTLAGSIYNGKVTRVLPGMQSAFVDIGLERDAFLYVTDFLEETDHSDDIDVTPLPVTSDEGRRGGRRGRGKGTDPVAASSVEQADEAVLESAPAEASGEGTDSESVDGEGRRWRGRRGRRRGRGSRGADTESTAGAAGSPDEPHVEPELLGSAEEPIADGFEESTTEAVAERPQFAGGSDRGRDRQRGGRDRGGRDRGGRDRERRPERSSYGETDEASDAPAGEPIILPGESLSKYRVGGDAPVEEKPAAQVIPTVSIPSFEVVGWDGGAVLPGETIRPRGARHAEPKVERVAAPVVEGASSQAAATNDFEPEEGASASEKDTPPIAGFFFRKKKKAVEPVVEEPVKAEAPPVVPEKPAQPRTTQFGEGVIVEEVVDEDEHPIAAMHAYSVDDDDLEVEEETLEGSPALGTLLREMSDVDEQGLPDEIEEGSGSDAAPATREPRRGRRDDRRGGRNSGRGNDRGRGRGRQSVQAQDLPAISELLKPGQEILVQIAKEPIAKKGARITSHIALPGRFLVFMPTVNHTGVSRKISSDDERRRLKSILLSEKGEASGGFIVRTAADGASEEELRSDLRFLINLWNDIKARSEGSKSPALIYHDLNLVERVLRDQVGDNFSAIWVDTEAEYERVLRFLQRFQPSLIRRVKLYTKQTPLFEQFGITADIDKALKSKVWLKSGGSIVINQTEALVAIDINTGKYVGKTARLEDTIVKTNLDAIPEIVRQIRLRDLGGIIVIDFIDMDDRKNRQKVLQVLEEELKTDRAPSKVLQFNDFGLVAITRKRVRQSLERTLSTPCAVCGGTGMVKSPVTVANEIYVEMRKMFRQIEKPDIMLRVHPEVVKQLKLDNARWLHDMEEMTSKTILVKSDPSLSPEQFDIH